MKKPKKTRTVNLKALTSKQQQLIKEIAAKEMVVVTGPAGTGKTYVVASMAAQYLLSGAVEALILTRPVVACGKSVGYLPGSLEEKLAPWVFPFMNVLSKYFTKGELDMFVKNGKIRVVPFEVMRGYSFDNCYVVLDEAQNATIQEMKMFVTRIGEASKTVVLGDVTQTDLVQGRETGLEMVQRMAVKHQLPVGVVEFEVDDIVRSGLCKDWVRAFTEPTQPHWNLSDPPDLRDLPSFITK